MRLNPASFNSFLAGAGGIGQDVMWRRSTACPCFNPGSGSPKLNCVHCGGKGRLWASPIRCHAGVASQSVTRQWAQFGQYENGDAILVVPESSALYEAGQYDRVLMLNSTDVFSLVLTRGNNDRINMAVQRLTRVYWYNASSQLVEGDVPLIEPSGNLVWPAGSVQPPPGTQYSITGARQAEYYVWGPRPTDRREHYGAKLPTKIVVRRFELFGRTAA